MNEREPDAKERILEAAEAEFLAKGYDRSRMQAIADRAQINKAMLHYHFRTKDELFAQIFKNKAGLLFPKVTATLRTQSDFIASTCDFVDSYFGMLIQNPFLPAFLLQVSANHLELLEQVAIEFPRKYVVAFEAAAKKKAIRPHDARQFIVSLLGMCVMPFVGKNLIKCNLDLDDDDYGELLSKRAEEIKRYVVLLLSPEPRPGKERR
jgi:AcrR family transcriptional regulator